MNMNATFKAQEILTSGTMPRNVSWDGTLVIWSGLDGAAVYGDASIRQAAQQVRGVCDLCYNRCQRALTTTFGFIKKNCGVRGVLFGYTEPHNHLCPMKVAISEIEARREVGEQSPVAILGKPELEA